ncbi:hypothetical protein LIPSTDRAFT_62120 [Lipomyces starkeyi NRRL Y-11557]|uniref:WD-like domain-containing protein n=1 Tax=Lipomyces starkeyi NRRL Y-11557 TaxID=675824 RepID=A0A1E3Q8Y4_LIPST|nr:hypothetical protein LIPSTDRAFT_62120 [Lipomyces starkeyi NRRL Y-11557]
MMSLAIDNGALGDAVYLYHLINYNGCVKYISYANGSDFFNDIILEVSHTGGQVTYEDLAASTNSQELAVFYRSLPPYSSVSEQQRLVKRQKIRCSSAHAAVKSAYVSLYNWFKSRSSVYIRVPPRSYCKHGCCVPNVNSTFFWNPSATDEKYILDGWKYIFDVFASQSIDGEWDRISVNRSIMDFLEVYAKQSMSGEWHGLSVNRSILDFCVSNRGTGLSLIDKNS